MSWRPTLSWENAQKRAQILQKIRQFFAEKNVIEVETPALSLGTVTDVHLEALSCKYNFLSDSNTEHSSTLYLQTSPEFHMKRLLAAGYQSIFQIAKAFRHEEGGRYHNPEFTLLEWYRIDFDHFKLMDEVSALLVTVLSCKQPKKITYQQLFINTVLIDPLTASADELRSVINSHNKLSDWLVEESSIDILLQFIFSEIIEPTIGLIAPCFVYDFPASQASLAKISSTDTRVAERFECYFQGIELVNGFNELTDAKLQYDRFKTDNEHRKVLGVAEKNIDTHFIAALEEGLPECAGVALGIDRLVMLALKAAHIDSVLAFPVDRA